ncbi:MAG: HigA family addiction module antidote protein [Proteobacteria bacterium]|nr:HigA family addiction module antidote protein [Pseudomonadota bacterium]
MATRSKRLKPVHPGDLLGRTMRELGISSYALAKTTGKTPTQIHRIVNRKASITANMALLIGKALGTSAKMWMNLQTQYDLEIAELNAPEFEVTPMVANGARVV